MKYIAIIDEEILENFRLDDRFDNKPGKLLVLEDLNKCTRAVELKPIKAPIVVIKNGDSAYLTQGHIDAMTEYEQRQKIESIQKDFAECSASLARIANEATIPADKFADSIRILEQYGAVKRSE